MSESAGETKETGSSEGCCEVQKPKSLPYKLDWYQTEVLVVVTVFAKNFVPDKVRVDFQDEEVFFTLTLNTGETVDRTLRLEKPIEPSRSSYKVLSTKLEIKLAKRDGLNWKNLEKIEEKKKPSKGKNWDKVVSEFEEEQGEGEEALNSLFQKIYAEGSDEVKKAMNKSFVESGGTELNTNWNAVKQGKVSIKPPEGMEWKTWDS
ncbi:protein SGT1 homolog [Cimex lectularius]|uniref:Uncharacterized protein n=1 Tax=Cimex lectularius TaxID=79782 RepID=A0A8I6TDN8_CIMLE|nr:protein SGT1 homolog [Cimex lectularius]